MSDHLAKTIAPGEGSPCQSGDRGEDFKEGYNIDLHPDGNRIVASTLTMAKQEL